MKSAPVVSGLACTVLACMLVETLRAQPPGACEPWPACKDDGGDDDSSGGTVADNPTEVRWLGAIQQNSSDPEVGPRSCLLQDAKPNGDHGVYVCQLGAPAVVYDLTGFSRRQLARNGDATLCEIFDGITLEPDAKYNYAWTDNCQDDGVCTIRILNNFSEEEMISAGTNVGLTTLEAFADVTEPGTDLNPFATSQLLNVDRINIDFTGRGKNKKLASCQYDVWAGSIQYESTPAP